MELHVSTSGFQVITLDDNETQFNLHVDKHLNVKLAIPYGGIEALRTSCIELEEGASLTILMKNVKQQKNMLNQQAVLHKDAILTIAGNGAQRLYCQRTKRLLCEMSS